MCGRFHSVYTLAPLAWTFLHVLEKKEAKSKIDQKKEEENVLLERREKERPRRGDVN